jgi:hypothetical protein
MISYDKILFDISCNTKDQTKEYQERRHRKGLKGT